MDYQGKIEEKICIPEAYLTAFNLLERSKENLQKSKGSIFINAAAGGVGFALA